MEDTLAIIQDEIQQKYTRHQANSLKEASAYVEVNGKVYYYNPEKPPYRHIVQIGLADIERFVVHAVNELQPRIIEVSRRINVARAATRALVHCGTNPVVPSLAKLLLL